MLLLYRLERYRAAQRLSVVRSAHFRWRETGSISSDAGCAVCRNGFFKLLRIDNAIWRQSLQSAMTRSLESVLDRHIRPSVRLSVSLSARLHVCVYDIVFPPQSSLQIWTVAFFVLRVYLLLYCAVPSWQPNCPQSVNQPATSRLGRSVLRRTTLFREGQINNCMCRLITSELVQNILPRPQN